MNSSSCVTQKHEPDAPKKGSDEPRDSYYQNIYLDCPLGQVVWRQLNLENLELKYRKYRERIEKRVGHMI